jgi:Spy/CpxP family protein refolding chaperone
MAYEIGITPAQQASIDKLHAQAIERVEPLLRQLDRVDSELWALEASAKSGDSSVEKMRKTAQDMEKKIEDVWSKYRKQVLALLTKEQRQQYEEGVVGYAPYGGWGDGRAYAPGYGPGYGYGRGMGWRGGYGRGRGRRW